ncbi:hypothetical protein C0J52_20625 [Blattella germanica]|nr:hypothetical protein C0J52_20625 [Blattella germanica]
MLMRRSSGAPMSTPLTLSMFSGILTVRAGPGDFFSIMFPVALYDSTYLRILFRLGTEPFRQILKWQQKCMRITDEQ